MSVYCAATYCKYNSRTSRCTAKRAQLNWHSVSTRWEGRQEYLKCTTYEMSDEAKKIIEALKAIIPADKEAEE